MGDIIQFKKKESKKEENEGPKVYPIIINPARIMRAIGESGWSEGKACMKSHVNHASLRKLKAGRMPKPDVLRRLCKTLDVPVSEVVYTRRRKR